ncbi:tryptophan 7-halogenase [Sphingomonas sp. A2-49]|uniref:tryptophan halogenase family protein n=1 Tax=Sphingomonas sp. A2-49 TaxID=1391375 RepID=UPI0021CF7AF5|nr:tryptophan halogenase family protein [Sphingomonas sp. A2-49]MCU6452780.1 tryptophan 7-halogenase [Sphingomonas sp. A2-49]
MPQPLPASIAILGGGTAGWMAACLMARAWPAARITVVESPEIGIVGVGEGSTPQLKALFETLGIAEAEWMSAADATYKTGIAFHGWADDTPSYFHPFAGQVDLHTQGAFFASAHARRLGADVPAHPDRFFLNARLATAGRAPISTENFPFRIGYGYHFDAHKVGDVLRRHALTRGVIHLPRRVTDVGVGADGNVARLSLDDGDAVTAELFVDASGFRSVIAQGALGVPFRSFAGNLFADRAVVMPTPRGPQLAVQTRATALSAGWAWDIPLTSRTGNGYVYASRYLSADAAETELRTHLGLLDADVAARHLTMKVGRVAESWHANCLAIGLAQGFVEPLEATALHIVQATVEGFIAAFGRGERAAFNAAIARRYEGIRDYIVAHYRLNRRGGDFWRAVATNDDLSDDLRAIMSAWFTGRDVAEVIAARDLGGFYAPMSWEVLLAGYGTFPETKRLRAAAPVADLAAVDRFLDGCLLNFPDHAAALARRMP